MPLAQRSAEQISNAEASAKNEAKGRLLRTEVRPPIVKEEPCVLEGGEFPTFRRKFIWKVHSSRLVNKSIPEVDRFEEYVEKRLNEIGA